jgi:hypothetical protein
MVWPNLVFWASPVPANVYTSGNPIQRLATDTELCKLHRAINSFSEFETNFDKFH